MIMTNSHLSLLSHLVIGFYGLVLFVLVLYGVHRYWILYLYWRHHKKKKSLRSIEILPPDWRPVVTIQLPLYNEMYVAERLIDTVCALDYPKEKLEIQVLDDSSDETVDIVAKKVRRMRDLNFDIA